MYCVNYVNYFLKKVNCIFYKYFRLSISFVFSCCW